MEPKEFYTMILHDKEGFVGEAVYAGPDTLKIVTAVGGAERLVRVIRQFALVGRVKHASIATTPRALAQLDRCARNLSQSRPRTPRSTNVPSGEAQPHETSRPPPVTGGEK